MNGFGIAIACLVLMSVALLYVPFRWRPVGVFLIGPKVLAVAYLPFIAAIGLALAGVGALRGWWWTAVPSAIGAAGALAVIVRTGALRTDLSGALGTDWNERISPERRATIVGRWWVGPLPRSREPQLSQDVPFATIPGTSRVLRCDVWRPAIDVKPSRVAVVYLHGSAYYILDKDFATRPLFRHLTAHGHVVVDVAHRLFPDTDVPGMVADAKRALGWVRAHAHELGIDPDRIVLAGGSSGGHLALLAAYSQGEPALTPSELAGANLSVRAVVSLYGQVDLAAMYHHTHQEAVCHATDRQPNWAAPPSRALVRLFGHEAARLRLQFMTYAGRCDWLLGGTPREAPETYSLVSVFRYVRPDCPPTLLMHGTHDEMAPAGPVRELQQGLERVGAPVTAIYLPHTDHMFDLVGPRWSPAARVAFHVLGELLAVISSAAPGGADFVPRERQPPETRRPSPMLSG